MRRLRYILASAVLLLPLLAAAQASEPVAEEDDIDVTEIIFEHVGDSYEWHITTVKDKPVAIHLPVILHSKTSGWHCFSSKHIAGGETYEGFRLAGEDEKHSGKLVEVLSDGSVVKPLDISITKNVTSLMLTSIIIMILVLCAARWYKKHDAVEEAPKGFAGLMEMLVTMVEDDIIKECVGKDYKRYSPYLLTAFFFIFINNLFGIVPFFPFGANVTGNIAVTFFLAMCTFIAVNVFGNKHYWKDILWPDVPTWLKIPPVMPLIEIIGMFTKPFSLMVRLFANILAGHCMIIGVVCVVFLTAKMGVGMNAGLSVVAVFIGVFMDVLELLVAFLQAYVFTMLSSVFIGMSRQEPETE